MGSCYRSLQQAKAKRRFVLGLREVSKHLKLRKLKCVIISSNVERIKSAGGLDDTLDGIINSCQEHQIPVVFALKRQLLGKVLLKKVPVSIVGIFNYDGAQEQFKTLIELTQKTRQAYSEKWQEIRQKLELQQKEITDTLVPTTEMDKMLSADGEEASKLPYITGEDADIKNHNAEVTESSDDDNDDDDDDDDHYDIEEEEEIVTTNTMKRKMSS
ncbi:Selenocysteine insertion sequence-binding protein 2-like [Desmophyllum pertusum]|uniref:Selenocysteine insertion sequence-binding protein 2-like n=1 Tax=Desmophyllum pertusum TaxID=174260 RepID=A0A9W9Z629_9CNID|nr:Selenocysteine insertion sequence-binding protein 2-like [Desmophyllum pertusum]